MASALRIALVLPSLSVGGTERVAAELASYLIGQGHAVAVITQRGTADDFYRLDQAVVRYALQIQGRSAEPFSALRRNCRLINRLRHTLRRFGAQVVFSFLPRTNIRTLIAARPMALPVVVCERNHLSQPLSLPWSLLRRLSYRRASALVVQTRRNAHEFRALLGSRIPIDIIPNPLTCSCLAARTAPRRALPRWWPDAPVVLAVGRLEPQKGFDLLVRALAAASLQLADHHVVILGTGSQRGALQQLAEELEIPTRIHLPGVVEDPYSLMRSARIFVLSSRFEGFPNVLLEAMSLGSACVSFDCPTGPAELIEHRESGLLLPAEDVAAMTQALVELAANEPLRRAFGSAAAMAAQRYLPDRVFPLWLRTIQRVVPATR